MKTILISILLIALMSCNKSTTTPQQPSQTNSVTIDTISKGSLFITLYQKCGNNNKQILPNTTTKLYNSFDDRVKDIVAYTLTTDNFGIAKLDSINILGYYSMTTGTVNYATCNNVIVQYPNFITINKNKTTNISMTLQ